MAKVRCGYGNLAKGLQRFADYVFQYDGTTYTDLTDAARSPETGDITATGSSTNHSIVVGFKDFPIYDIRFIVSTIAAGGTRNWRYWNGSAITTFTPTIVRGHKDFTMTTDYIVDGVWRPADVPTQAKTSIAGKYGYFYWFQVASTTNSPVFSQIFNQTMVASTEELATPSTLAGMASPSDKWQSRSRTIEVKRGRNDKIDYDIGGGELTLTLTSGVYRAAEFASHVETLLGVGFTTTWNSAVGYRITAAAGTLNLRCATGTNKAQSAYPMMGFDCSSNKTGALTYTANYPKRSSGGSFMTTASTTGEFNDGGGRSISLAAGNWDTASIQAKVKQLADASGGGFTDFDLKYDEENLTYTFKRAGGNVSIINASPLFNTVLKIADAGAAASQTGTTSIHNPNAEWLILTEPIANLNDIALFGTNFQASATISLQHLSAADTWTTLGAFTLDGERGYYKQDDAAAPDDAIYRILISDASNDDGYVAIGTVVALDLGNEYFEMSRNIQEQPSESANLFEDKSQSTSGVSHTVTVGEQDVFDFRVYAINNTDKASLKTMQRVIGTGRPFLFIPDRDLTEAEIVVQMIWGTLAGPMTFSEVDKVGLIHEVNLPLVEFI